MKRLQRLALVLSLAVPCAIAVAQEPAPKDKPAGGKDGAPAKKDLDALLAKANAMTPVEEVVEGLWLMYPRFWSRAIERKPGSPLVLQDHKMLLAQVETALAAPTPESASAADKAIHARLKAHADAARKLFGALEKLDGAPAQFLVPQLKPHELPLAIEHATADEKSVFVGLLVGPFLAQPVDTAQKKPAERMQHLLADVALPACAAMAPHARELGLEQIGVCVPQLTKDAAAGADKAVQLEMVVAMFPVAELERYVTKVLDTPQMLTKAQTWQGLRGAERPTKFEPAK